MVYLPADATRAEALGEGAGFGRPVRPRPRHSEANPSRYVGAGFVIGLHLLLGYALVSGLGARTIRIVTAPLQVRLIQDPVRPPDEVPPPPPPPAPERVARVEPDLDVAHSVDPVYPAMSRRLGEEGIVSLLVLVGADGIVTEVRLEKSSGFPRLDEAATNAAKNTSRFVPGKVNGKPEAMWYRYRYQFTRV